MVEGKVENKEINEEKIILFDFDEKDCDVIISTSDDKKIHLPSNFLKMASGEKHGDVAELDLKVNSKDVILALSFYCPKYWIENNKLCKYNASNFYQLHIFL